MDWIGFVLAAVGVVVIVVVVLVMLRRPRPDATPIDPALTDLDVPTGEPEPSVTSVEIEDGRVVVEFDTPVPPDEETVRRLTATAVEVVRRRTLDLDLQSARATAVVAKAGPATEVGRVDLTGGRLPDPASIHVVVTHAAGADPLLDHGVGPRSTPKGPVPVGPDRLGAIGAELGLPVPVVEALAARGIDPSTADAPEIVRGVLAIAGWTIDPRDDRTYLASRGGTSMLVREVPHEDGHPELDEAEVTSAVMAVGQHKASSGVLVTAKLVPFHITAKERATLRVVGRQRLAQFLGSLVEQ